LLFLVPEPEQKTSVGRVPGGAEKPPPTGPAAHGPANATTSTPLIAFLAVLFVFSLGNSADAFLLLRLSDALGGATYIPLLWAGLHVVKASLSTWGGDLSDRFGRKRIIVAGWILYAIVYLGFAMATTAAWFITWFLVYGAFFALTEGAEKALVADLTPASRAGAAFGWYNATLGAGALTASVTFGFLYERFSAAAAFGTGAALAAVAAVLLMWVPSGKIVSSDAQDSRDQ
jgi:MFS family permease